jgi:pyruvate formate lyase activating enzyme
MGDSVERYPSVFYRSLADERIACEVCPRDCKLSIGQRGFCFVRQNFDGILTLSTYGRSSGFCVDPIEKKPLFHFLPGSASLSFGTAGCNLSCAFCQNHEISKSREVDTSSTIAMPETIANAAVSLGCRTVAFTYNDPIVFFEYAVDVAKACKAVGVKNVAVTSGYINEQPRRIFFEAMDATNVDLKSFSEHFYWRYTTSHLAAVLDTLLYIRKETGVWLEITTLLIPELNDSEEEIDAMTKWIASELGPDVPLHFTGFTPQFRMNDRKPTPKATLDRARSQALANGLHHVYVGNFRDAARQTTVCPVCETDLIRRDWNKIEKYGLTEDGECPVCRHALCGHFDRTAGQWGRKRLSIPIDSFKAA